ncbi:MAG: CCA tRNA nucleotidyltransferase [Candidatus Aenigmarchaeota archaeon]|nr:CCA tRNA nucleotidyltransferase [Candidatus Aenigmarchaeota archaeon]
MTMDSILEKALKKITPSEEERKELEEDVKKILKTTEEIIRPKGLGHTLSGSIIRDTWLPHKKDFDLFILFPENAPREELEKQGLLIGKTITRRMKGSYVIAYAEHPYTRAVILGYDVDIVPCYSVKSAEKIKSAVDRTPFHNRWIQKNFPLRLSGDVRLLKQFTKSMGVYGSDTKVQGFSGYLCEILVANFGSLKNLLKSASKWKTDVYIDIEKYHKELPEDLKRKFKNNQLIVIDPVDKNRNVAAALSPENFARFVEACQAFLKKPSGKFFSEEKSVNLKQLENSIKKRETVLLAIKFKSPEVIPDILFPQLRKFGKRLKEVLEDEEFQVFGNDVYGNGYSMLLLELNGEELPKVKKIEGPPIDVKDRSDEFTKKYKKIGKVWIEENKCFSEIKREFIKPEQLLRETLKGSFKKLRERGVPSYIAKSIRKRYQFLNEKQIISLAKKDKEFALFLKEYVNKVC